MSLFNFFRNHRDTSLDHMLNMDNDVLFIHIPKNAGTSIIESLNLKKTTHITAKEINNSGGRKFLKQRYSFAIIRSPYERFISLYNYAKMPVSYYHNNINPSLAIYGKHLDYELLKNASLLDCAIMLKEGKLKHDLSWNHWQPQYLWLFDEEYNCLVDKLYNLNNLNELKDDMLVKFNRELTINLINSSKSNLSAGILDKKAKQIVDEFYAKDFELLFSNKLKE